MDNHENTKKILKITGGVLLGIGAILAIVGFIDFFTTMGEGGGMPKRFWCLFLGLPLCGVGGALLSVGFRREIMRYGKNEAMPVINEASEELQPVFQNVAEAIKQGAEVKNNVCKTCGTANDGEAKFCKSCGKPLTITCPMCGESNMRDSSYCDNCGEKLH